MRAFDVVGKFCYRNYFKPPKHPLKRETSHINAHKHGALSHTHTHTQPIMAGLLAGWHISQSALPLLVAHL